MLKRILIIGFFTGIAQIVSLFVIKILPNYFSSSEIASIAQIDSLIFFLINLIALGLQPSAMRNIAITENWLPHYHRAQSARVAFSFILFGVGLLAFFKWEYSTFFLAPLFALSGDYALYAVGKSTKAALFASIRLAVPYIILIAAAFFYTNQAAYIFMAGWIVVYFVTNKLIAQNLKVNSSIKFDWKDLKIYVQSLPLGFVSLSFYFLGTGIILVTAFFYPAVVQAVAFSGLKMYVIFKGILRIIHQAFFKEMILDEWCLRVDQLSMLIALTYAGSYLLFPKSFIILFFGSQYLDQQGFFLLLALASIVYCFILSSATRSLLDKMDRKYSMVCTVAAVCAIISTIILSYFSQNATSIGVSVLIGETILCLGLLKISNIKNLFKSRIKYFVSNLIWLIIPLMVRILFQDSLEFFIVDLIVFGLVLGISNYKRFVLFNAIS